MIERATWRRSPERIWTPLGAVLKGERVRGLPASWWIFGYAAVYGFLRQLADHLLPSPWADFVHLLLSAAAIGALVEFVFDRKPSALAPDPAPCPIFPVGMRLRMGDRVTGDDQGVSSFTDGWLVFEGQETAFSLRNTDVAETLRVGETRILVLQDGQRVELTLKEEKEGFGEGFERWRREPASPGLSRLPPKEPNIRAGAAFPAFLQGIGAFIAGLALGVVLSTPFLPAGKGSSLAVLASAWGIGAVFALLARLLYRERRRRGGATPESDALG